MFGLIYIKPSPPPIIDPTVLKVTGAMDPINIGYGEYTHINGNYNKVHDNYFSYDKSQESYDPEGEMEYFEYSFDIQAITFKTIISDHTLSEDCIIDKIYINDTETDLTEDDVIYSLTLNYSWEGPIAPYYILYYSLNGLTGTYIKNNLKIIFHDVYHPQDIYEWKIDENNRWFIDAFNTTFDQLPDTINVTAIQ